MKVLKKGRDYQAWTKDLVCSGEGNGKVGCGALLKVTVDDLYNTYAKSNIVGGRNLCITFCCPSCMVESDVYNYSGPRTLPDKKTWFEQNGEIEWL